MTEITINIDEALLARIEFEARPDESAEEWVEQSIRDRLADIDRELAGSVPTEIDAPPEIRERARLRAASGGGDAEDAVLDYLSLSIKGEGEE